MNNKVCEYCLQIHPEGEENCTCCKCGTTMHPQFIRTVVVDNKPNVACPNCYNIYNPRCQYGNCIETATWRFKMDGKLYCSGHIRCMTSAGHSSIGAELYQPPPRTNSPGRIENQIMEENQ